MNNILDYFEKTASSKPEQIAFKDVRESVTFSELKNQAKRVATSILKEKTSEKVVAFYTDKSVKTVVGFLGAVYAGCAYTQINLRFPAERVNSLIETVNPCIIVTDRTNYEKISSMINDGIKLLVIEDLIKSDVDECLISKSVEKITDIQPLYINFTSGSTGKPKGVAVGHRSVIDFITNFTEIFYINENDVIANQAPFDFDVSVKDIYSGLFTGATVAIIPTEYFMSPVKLMDFICDSHATVLIWAVSALCFITSMNALDYKIPTELRTVMFSGEVMPIKHLNKLKKYLPDVSYVNLYGPTEITCNCMYYVVDRDYRDDEKLPLGVAFPNEDVFVVDDEGKQHRLDDAGLFKGELCVCGSCLALGYYRDSEKTAEAFVRNPFNIDYPEIMYKTGDLVEKAEDGQLYYLSRKDNQIKHMGHRIELTEIESTINAVNGIDRVCCFFDEKKGRIIAVYVGEAEKSDIVDYLSVKLPAYMFPKLYYKMEAFPINKNGKIDRKTLREEYETKGEKK